MLTFPPFRLDREEGRLWRGEAAVALRNKPFAILCYLAAHPRKLVTHAELLAEVWGGAVVSDSAMRSHLHELRQVLGEGVIETVIGRGYRFVAEIREEAPASALQARTPGGPDARAPLVVGRDAELATLRAALERAHSGRRQLCFVSGEPGIGKTTLVRTFLAGLDASSVAVARGACIEQHGSPEPYLAIIEALGGLTRSARGSQVTAALVRHAPTFLAQVPGLVSEAQLADVTRRAAGGSEARQLRELAEALEAICADTPLVLALEDLQWSDVATIDLVSLLGQREGRAQLLIVCTTRHAEIQAASHPLQRVMRSLVARSGAHLVPVSAIGVDAVQRLVDGRFPGHTFPPRLAALVAHITGGTPLFVVSLLDELVGRGMLAETDGRWSLAVPVDEVEAHRPASVKQLIDMQLDRLAVAEQRALEAASVVGAEFSADLVAAALELPVDEVDDACDALRRRGAFLRAEAHGRYAFTHALVQEACAERSSPARRQRWHRRVAEALEADPRAAELAHLRAEHFDAAGDAARAVPAYAEAARHAAARYATSDAVASCGRALDLLPQLPPSRERDRLELEILGTTCQQVSSNTFSAAFAGRDALTVYRRAIALARSLGDVPRTYAAITQLCNYDMIVARYDDSDALMAELERIEAEHDLDPLLLHAGLFARGYIAFFRGEVARAIALFERLVEGPEFVAHRPGRVLALGHLACARWVAGEPDRAREEARATMALADELGVPILQALAHVVRARLHFLRGEPPSPEESLLAVQAAALDVGLHTEARALALWAQARRAPLPLAEIQPLLDAMDQRLREVSTCSTLLGLVLIDVLRLSGHPEEARRRTDAMITFATERSERVYLPALLRVREDQLGRR